MAIVVRFYGPTGPTATFKHGKWRCDDPERAEVLNEYSYVVWECEYTGYVPWADWYIAQKVAEPFDGEIIHVKRPRQSPLPPGAVE
ncbi:MAG TPA: hypothetical protein VGW38_04660 [Chloroflexota bacterium]|nr:hypothetical protein [Chloroflexota bacterium]